MSDKVKYLFTNETTDGTLVFRSTVASFGLDHTTDKDLYSFYTNFSGRAYFDSGLLPVDGSGILSIRRALQHTQVTYQHAPGKYYINWADYEGQSSANKYYVAQPYRIVIIDFLNDNIYGARTFYSPTPITHAHAPLYHTNLPNINCRGYRGNGVGWICLYHTDDVSEYPFNERLIRALDRCSGTETYNDANMSETDGTRFYRDYRSDMPFLYQPSEWESRTAQEGWEWTLDPDLWIPVLVTDWDHQGAHDPEGQPLTLVDALFGDYQVYYTDMLIPKPVNAIARSDKELDRQHLFNEFKLSYVNASTSNNPLNYIDNFAASLKVKAELANASAPVIGSNDEDEDEDDGPEMHYVECIECHEGQEYDPNFGLSDDYEFVDSMGDWVCHDCLSSFYIYDDLSGEHVRYNDSRGIQLTKEYKNLPSICFLCSDNASHERYSFRTEALNMDKLVLNEYLKQIRGMFPQAFWGTELQVRVPSEMMSFVPADVKRWADEYNHGTQNLVHGDLLYEENWYIKPASYFTVAFGGLCSGCVHQMLENNSSFSDCYAVLQDLVINGFGRLNEYGLLTVEQQRFVRQVMTDEEMRILPFS